MSDKYGEIEDRTVDVVADVLRNIDSDMLRKAVRQLKSDEQELMCRLYLDEPTISQAEYAEEHGMKENSVAQKVWRTKEKIRRILEK